MKEVLFVSALMAVLCFNTPVFAVCPSMDVTGDCRVDLEDFVKIAQQWQMEGTIEPAGMVWVPVRESGFSGQMSKYETTNTQYCQFLNASLLSGDITVANNTVYGAQGQNTGDDFPGQVYYNLTGAGVTSLGATNGGSARILYNGTLFSVISGFENHPVTFVSWYGAAAFCSYYGYRLPTESEWKAVADFNGKYIYACGTMLSAVLANYSASAHPDGTSDVGTFGTFGYGLCDMAGNVSEWTSSLWDPQYAYRVICGGGWLLGTQDCLLSARNCYTPRCTSPVIGFRASR